MSMAHGQDSSKRTAAVLDALEPRERAKLAAILARLGSPYDGERAAAGLAATAFIARHGLEWADLTALLRPHPKPQASAAWPQGPDRRRNNTRDWRGYCRRRAVQPGRALDSLA